MTNGVTIEGISYKGPVLGATEADPLIGAFACSDELLPPNPNIPTSTGLFIGSLSAHGNIVAMTVNSGAYNYVDNNGFIALKPFLTGYMREYWRDPTKLSLGIDTAIPALTGVVPSSITSITGNLLYYIDLQITRLTGNNFVDNFSFINIFNQVLNWVSTSNNYLVALKTSEDKSLQYFGSTNYSELLSQGFSQYKNSVALRQSLLNIGRIVTEINEGYFGTSNSIANIMLRLGLGNIGNLTSKLSVAGINVDNIYNENYTQQISAILQTITAPSDLNTIQQVLKTTVRNLTSPLDYTSLEKTSGVQNDSPFQSLADFGKDIKNKSPFLAVETGRELVEAIDLVLNEVTSNVLALSAEGKLLPQEIINQLRSYLPVGVNNGPVTMIDVIGMCSGYLTNDFRIVNENLLYIEQSAYGPQLHAALRDIAIKFKAYKSVPSSADAEGQVVTNNFFENQAYLTSLATYKNLVDSIAADPQFAPYVEKCNAAYLRICEATARESINFGKANFSTEIFRENSLIYSFVDSLPSYATDTQNIASDTLLYNMLQRNQAGDIAKSILNLYKNNQTLGNVGVKITGIV
jgi:hypothetical protein